MKLKHVFQVILYLGVLAVNIVTIANAAVVTANPANYRNLVDNLNPGDTLQLEAGIYYDGLNIVDLHGEEGNEIIIQGPTSGDAAIFYPRSCCNTVQLSNASYITIRHLTLDGQGTEGYIDAVNSRNITHHITVEHVLITNYDAIQGNIGISTKGPAWDWVIRYNTIASAGTGMYLGNSDGNLPFVRGLIEYNLIYDTVGYNIEIKHQNPRPTNIGMPTGDNKTIVRHNVFSRANNASGGGAARPNLLVGHWPLSGTGSNDLYEIYGNFFYQNQTERLFQGEGNFSLYNNIFINDMGDAIHVVPHNDIPKNVVIFFNTIVSNGRGMTIANADPNSTQLVKGNAIFANTPVVIASSNVTETANVTDTYANAVNYLINPTANGTLNPYPVAGMLSGAAIDTSDFQTYSDWGIDFNGTTRDGTFKGAYSGEGTNTGWLPSAREFKGEVNDNNPVTPDPGPEPEPDPDQTPPPSSNDNQTSNEDGAGASSILEIALFLVTAIYIFLFHAPSRRRTIQK